MQQKYRVPLASCPYCHYTGNGAGDPGKQNPRPPAPGDFTVCFGCTGVSVYAEEFQLRKPTLAEWQELLANPVCFASVKHLQQEIARVNPPRSPLSH
jgi:hypothetical protein